MSMAQVLLLSLDSEHLMFPDGSLEEHCQALSARKQAYIFYRKLACHTSS